MLTGMVKITIPVFFITRVSQYVFLKEMLQGSLSIAG